MVIMELFSGSGNVSKAFREKGFTSITLDVNAKYNPDICIDVLEFIPAIKDIDVIWASPPCEAFSVTQIGRNWNKDDTPKTDKAVHGLLVLNKTIEIIKTINPKMFWIENPVGKMRKMPILAPYRRCTVTYCQYGDFRMKPTDIWTNTDWEPRPMCNRGDPCHVAAPRGSQTGTQGMKDAYVKGIIPDELCEELAKYAERKLKGR